MRKPQRYTIENEYIKVTFLNIGAIITELVVKNPGMNVIVGHYDLNQYIENNKGYMNAVIGRHAGRCRAFLLDGQTVQPTYNEGSFQLHGGHQGFHQKEFEVEHFSDRAILRTKSPHLEEGFPGTVNFEVEYRLQNSELHLYYRGKTDRLTILNCTHHAYFNLNGDVTKPITNHILWLKANHRLELDEKLVPYRLVSTIDSIFDFNQPKAIGQDISDVSLDKTKGYDHPYILQKEGKSIEHVATLSSPLTGLTLEVWTNQQVLVLYTGNFIDEGYFLNDKTIGYPRCAVCLETQGVPNAQNIEGFKHENRLEADQTYLYHTVWSFKSSS
ncbi:MAG TPA: aldose epimerase family protein [Haloplasmataceae bacterium]